MHGHSMVRPGGVLEVGQFVGLVGGLHEFTWLQDDGEVLE